jgi:hypothetical protein
LISYSLFWSSWADEAGPFSASHGTGMAPLRSKYPREASASAYDSSSQCKTTKWPRILAYVTGPVNQGLLMQNEYSAAENATDHPFPPVDGEFLTDPLADLGK